MNSQSDFSSDALFDYLRDKLPHTQGKPSITRMTGGQSNPTYALSFSDGAHVHQYALRKKPPGQLLASAHAVEREYAVMRALASVNFPVPTMHHLCEDASIIGTPFFVMDFLDGRILYDPTLPNMQPKERAAIHDAANATIAQLHQVNYTSIGLESFGKTGNYMARQIDRWTKQYQASEQTPIHAMHRLIEWLPANMPTPGDEKISIVHGDYRIDNLVFAKDSATVIGVLDWELSTLGNPIADFAYHCMSWHIPAGGFRGLAGANLGELGIPDENEYIKRYCQRTGFDAESLKKDWPFYLAYNLFRVAAIIVGVAARAAQGNAASKDAAKVGTQAAPLAQLAWSIAQRSY